MQKRILAIFIGAALLLGACRLLPPTPPVVVVTVPPPAGPDVAALRLSAQELPGVAVLAEEPLTLAYPDERLFSVGAALPLAGGVEMLDPLSDWLLARPELRWQITVRAVTSHGADYDGQLAHKRQELLQRYLHNRGVTAQLDWQASGAAGAPLELRLLLPAQLPAAATSAGEKR